jgi:hypothetical protein
MAPRRPPSAPRAKNVIYLFMAGGPSQLELFDHKPKLVELNGQQIPESYVAGRRFAFMDSFAKKERPRLLGTRRKFARHGRAARGSASASRTRPRSSTTSRSSTRSGPTCSTTPRPSCS